MTINGIDESSARKIIRALRKGLTPVEYAQNLFVGQARWFKTALKMMNDTACDRDFEVRFLRAAYGGGKTMFLRCLESAARNERWVSAYIVLRHEEKDEVQLDKFNTIVAEVGRNIELPDGQHGISALLRAALEALAGSVGYSVGGHNTLITMAKAGDKVIEFCSSAKLDYGFTLAMQAAMHAMVDGDNAYINEIANWIGRGGDALIVDPAKLSYRPVPPQTLAQPVHLKPVGLGSAEQLIRLLAFLAAASGHKGLFLAIDEIELIIGLSARRRANAFQTLRALLEMRVHPPSTSLFLAATPQMFEDPSMFPSYKALQDRIGDTTADRKITFKEPVIDLDRTELTHEELKSLAEDIVLLYRAAGEEVENNAVNRLPELIDTVSSRRYVIAKPRLLCRCTVDLLDGNFGPQVSQVVATTSKKLEDERAKQIRGQ